MHVSPHLKMSTPNKNEKMLLVYDPRIKMWSIIRYKQHPNQLILRWEDTSAKTVETPATALIALPCSSRLCINLSRFPVTWFADTTLVAVTLNLNLQLWQSETCEWLWLCLYLKVAAHENQCWILPSWHKYTWGQGRKPLGAQQLANNTKSCKQIIHNNHWVATFCQTTLQHV